MPDYSYVDQPYLLQMLFYPRADFTRPPEYAWDLFAETEDGNRIASRFYSGGTKWPWILYFHGNGEVWHLDVGSSHPGAGEGPKGWAVRPLKRYVSWVQNVVRQFGPYPSQAQEN
jgi:hypothetical protein